jgi:hypothetical protein
MKSRTEMSSKPASIGYANRSTKDKSVASHTIGLGKCTKDIKRRALK